MSLCFFIFRETRKGLKSLDYFCMEETRSKTNIGIPPRQGEVAVDSAFKTKSDLHLARKIWHCLGVLFIIFLYHRLGRIKGTEVAIVVTASFLVVDILRQSIPTLNRVVCLILSPIMRESERNTMAGTSWLMIGTSVLVFSFSQDVVTLSLLFLAIADPLASFVGNKYGKDKIVGDKSLQGTLAAFFACMIVSACYFYFNNLMTERILIVSLLAGIIGALSELLPIWKLDDNLTLPLLSAFLLRYLFIVFGGA